MLSTSSTLAPFLVCVMFLVNDRRLAGKGGRFNISLMLQALFCLANTGAHKTQKDSSGPALRVLYVGILFVCGTVAWCLLLRFGTSGPRPINTPYGVCCVRGLHYAQRTTHAKISYFDQAFAHRFPQSTAHNTQHSVFLIGFRSLLPTAVGHHAAVSCKKTKPRVRPRQSICASSTIDSARGGGRCCRGKAHTPYL